MKKLVTIILFLSFFYCINCHDNYNPPERKYYHPSPLIDTSWIDRENIVMKKIGENEKGVNRDNFFFRIIKIENTIYVLRASTSNKGSIINSYNKDTLEYLDIGVIEGMKVDVGMILSFVKVKNEYYVLYYDYYRNNKDFSNFCYRTKDFNNYDFIPPIKNLEDYPSLNYETQNSFFSHYFLSDMFFDKKNNIIFFEGKCLKLYEEYSKLLKREEPNKLGLNLGPIDLSFSSRGNDLYENSFFILGSYSPVIFGTDISTICKMDYSLLEKTESDGAIEEIVSFSNPRVILYADQIIEELNKKVGAEKIPFKIYDILYDGSNMWIVGLLYSEYKKNTSLYDVYLIKLPVFKDIFDNL